MTLAIVVMAELIQIFAGVMQRPWGGNFIPIIHLKYVLQVVNQRSVIIEL